ncbi:MAG: PQQ-dependent sugar dehydrogenase [Nitrososphaeraceae archaeon]
MAVDTFVEGLDSPTSMVFLNKDDILVLEKKGQLRLVSNGQLQAQPVLQVPVNTESERGLLGITVMNGSSSGSSNNQITETQSIFLYYTESGVSAGEGELRNRVYRYNWDGQTLANPTLILDLPAIPGPNHDGGKLMIGPDNYLYAIIGDLNRDGKLQNFPNGPDPDDTSVIFRVSPADGSSAPDNPLSATSDPDNPLSSYYAYGIRNSFGLTFDPVTGNIWDTENGPASNDEINLVRPGFNSGWQTIMGPISSSGNTEADLVRFTGSQYADPILTWLDPVAVTDIEFLESTSLGESYLNNVFVGDDNFGNLYYFVVNPDRTGFVLDSIPDLVVDNEEEQSSIVFGSGFGSITDIETGPDDGYLYILSYDNGIIYRVLPSTVSSSLALPTESADAETATTTMPSTVGEQESEAEGESIVEGEEEDDDTEDNGNNN